MTDTASAHTGSKGRAQRTGPSSAIGLSKPKRSPIANALALVTPLVSQPFLDRHNLRDPLNHTLNYGVKTVFSAASPTREAFGRIPVRWASSAERRAISRSVLRTPCDDEPGGAPGDTSGGAADGTAGGRPGDTAGGRAGGATTPPARSSRPASSEASAGKSSSE